MAQKKEVLIQIFIDQINDRMSEQILELLTRLHIQEKYFTEGTNHITAFTKGNESEISEKVTEIANSPHVKKVMKAVLVPV